MKKVGSIVKKQNGELSIYHTKEVPYYIGEKYYRLYRFFDMETKKLGSVGVNRFKVGDITNDFSTTGIKTALAENEIGVKTMYDDIGIMQKFTTRVENGTTYYYTGGVQRGL